MSELGWDTRYHLAQLAQLDGGGKGTPRFAKVLTEENPMLEDMPIYSASDALSHSDVRENSLPTPQVIKVGDGWDASKAEWAPFTETLSMFKDRIDIPRDVLRTRPDAAGKRLLIEDRHKEGFGQGVCNHLIYGSSVANPEKFDGLSVRYATPDASNPINPTNGDYGVYDIAGSGSDTSSIFIIQWGIDKVCGLCPPNDPNKGLRIFDMGKQYKTAENSKETLVYRTELEWDLGLLVFDYRAVARIRNIECDMYNLATSMAANVTLCHKIIQARNNMKGKTVPWMYVSAGIYTQLDIMQMDKNNVHMSDANPWGRPMLMWRDMPIRKMDAISETETAVAAA